LAAVVELSVPHAASTVAAPTPATPASTLRLVVSLISLLKLG
jgi:hypothetical protein